MASGPSVSALKQTVIEDYLSCSICTETYREPHQLQCQHTFCLHCIEAYVKSSNFATNFPCPICRKDISIKNGVLDMQKNLLIANILSFFKNVKDETTTTETSGNIPWSVSNVCTICEEERKPHAYCFVCSSWLCEPCTRGHKKLPATKTHSLLLVEEFYKFIDMLLVEKCLKTSSLKSELELNLASLDSAGYKVADTRAQIEIEINQKFQILQRKIENQRKTLIDDLEAKSLSISGGIEKMMCNLQILHENISEIENSYEELKKNPTLIQDQQIDDLEKHADILADEYSKHQVDLVDVLNVSKIEYKAIVDEEEGSLGHLFLCPDLEIPRITPPDGIVRLMQQSSEGNQITDITVFDDKHYLVASSGKLLYFDDNKEINIPIMQIQRSAWGLAKLSNCVNNIILTDMGNCLGSGKISILPKNLNATPTFSVNNILVSGLTSPRGISVGDNGYIFVCDQYDRCVYCLSSDGKLKKIIKRSPDGSFLFTQPMFVTQNKNGDIIVSDHGSFVKIVNSAGDLKATYVSRKPKSEFWGLTTDRDGNILVTDWSYGVHILTENGDFKELRSDFPYGTHPISIDKHPNYNSFMIGTSSGEIFYMN